MPISFRCPHCQMKLAAPDHAAKQSFSCPNCKGNFALPSVSVQQKQPAPIVPAQQPAQQIFAGLQEAASSTTEASEPWFFRFISFFAYLIIGIGIAVFAVGLLVLAFIFLKVLIETRSLAAAAVGVLGVLYLVIYLMGVNFSGAMILLFLDMARSFRFLRIITQKMDKHQD